MRSMPRRTVISDASGSWGCGAFCDSGAWFQLPWGGAWESVHITCKELLPIVVACAVWGRAVQGGVIRCRTDNAAVVLIVNKGQSKNELAMHLMRCLAFFAATLQIVVRAEHVPGWDNAAADAFSRDKLALFRLQVPSAAERSFHKNWSPCWYTLVRTAPCRSGEVCSTLLYKEFSTVYSSNL